MIKEESQTLNHSVVGRFLHGACLSANELRLMNQDLVERGSATSDGI
jgi:hypothetical protein